MWCRLPHRHDLQRRGIVDEVQAADDRIPERDGAAEAVEQGQAAQHGVGARHVQTAAELRDIGDQIAVGEHHALGLAGTAAGKEQQRLLVTAALRHAEKQSQQGRRQQLAQNEP